MLFTLKERKWKKEKKGREDRGEEERGEKGVVHGPERRVCQEARVLINPILVTWGPLKQSAKWSFCCVIDK